MGSTILDFTGRDPHFGAHDERPAQGHGGLRTADRPLPVLLRRLARGADGALRARKPFCVLYRWHEAALPWASFQG